jgi:ComF family protein
VGEYFGQLAAMIRAYKYGRHEEFEPILSAFLTEVVARSPWFERVETIVPVPSYWTRRLRRPIHPAEVLAARVASVAGLPIARLLRRTRGGPHQVGLNYTARIANAQGAFAVRSGVELRNTRLLLIDDVRTSGATLEECARVLRRKGAAEVYAGVLVTVSGASAGAAVLTKI